MIRRAISALVLAVALLASVAGHPQAAAAPTETGTDPVIVRFRPESDSAERSRALAAQGLRLLEGQPGGDFALALPAARSKATATADVIEAVAPSRTVRAHAVPNDPAYQFQWHLPMVEAPAAWDLTTGVGATVAVIDTGVASHDRSGHRRAPDLAQTRFVDGWDFVDGDTTPDDHNGHGTHVAGTIAQSTGNGIGGAGLAYGATIMPLRVLDAQGVGSDWDVAQALRFAADNGADVANLSLGGPEPSAVLGDAVAYAWSKGVTVVASSGNAGASSVAYPAAFPEVIAVGAVRLDATRPAYSNYGSALDLVAPGGDLALDQNGDGYGDGILQQTLVEGTIDEFCYCFLTGTSMASPHVAAAAALLVAEGAADPEAVRAALIDSALDLGPPGWDSQYGHGLLQAGAALGQLAAGPPGSFTPGVSARPIDAACPADRVPAGVFADVSVASTHAPPIDCVAWWGVANGTTATSFAPSGTVTRAQMASFVARTLEASGVALPADPPNAFSDDDASVHGHRINQLAAVGVVQGTGAGTYGPADPVSRAAMATFLVRAHDVVAATPLTATGNHFIDDTGLVHEANIDRAAEAGLAAGTGARRFSPRAPVQRAQMASFLARTLDLLVTSGDIAVRGV